MPARLIAVAPTPPSPDWSRPRFARGNVGFRAFGQQKEDLEVDFGLRPQPLLETQILLCCGTDAAGQRLDAPSCWELEVGRRIEALLTIAALAGTSTLSIPLHCPNAKCGQSMETELTVEEIVEIQRRAEAAEPTALVVENKSFVLRKPTGVDQLLWLEASYPDAARAMRSMVETLIAPGQREEFQGASQVDGWLPVAERALEAQDPLVDAALEVRCPSCDALARYPLDLAGLAIERLREVQGQLFTAVHRLASGYGWSEAECFEVPAWRRARYLELLDEEGS